MYYWIATWTNVCFKDVIFNTQNVFSTDPACSKGFGRMKGLVCEGTFYPQSFAALTVLSI